MIEIRRLTAASDINALAVFLEKTFDESRPLRTAPLTEVPAGLVALAAYDDSQLVGGLVAYELRLVSGAVEFYLYDIAVDTAFRRRGIGKALIQELRAIAEKRGASTIFVEAEEDDTEAVDFYRSLGVEELRVRHFNIPLE